MGETQVEPACLWSPYVTLVDTWSYYALMLNRTLLGMQLLDVIKAIEYLEMRPDVDASRISCLGWGTGALLAMHAAAMDERIGSVTCTGSLITFKSLIDEPTYRWGGEVFVPHVLKHYDLPDIAACVAPRPLRLARLLDQHRAQAGLEAARRAYAWAGEVYRLLGADGAFVVE